MQFILFAHRRKARLFNNLDKGDQYNNTMILWVNKACLYFFSIPLWFFSDQASWFMPKNYDLHQYSKLGEVWRHPYIVVKTVSWSWSVWAQILIKLLVPKCSFLHLGSWQEPLLLELHEMISMILKVPNSMLLGRGNLSIPFSFSFNPTKSMFTHLISSSLILKL